MKLPNETDSGNEKRLSIGSIQSYKPLSKNASRLLEHLIDFAVDRVHTGETTHILSFSEVIQSFGLTNTNDWEYIRAKIKEIKDLDVVQWDFMGEEHNFLQEIKDRARNDIDKLIERPYFKSIVETEHFQKINNERLDLARKHGRRSKVYNAKLDSLLDLLFPIYVGNTKIFEAIDLHRSKVSFSLNRHLIDLFVNPSVYGVLDMSINFLFRSSYSMRLYQNACIYRHNGVTPWFTVDQAKMIFCVEKICNSDGELEFKHKQYSQFKRNVIASAVKECNMFHEEGRLPFKIELEEDNTLSKGKSVDQLRFHIVNVNQSSQEIQYIPALGVESVLDDDGLGISTSELMLIVDEMCKFRVKREVAIEAVEYACIHHGASFSELMKNIEYCQNMDKKKRARGNQRVEPGYVVSAIRKGYEPYGQSEADAQESSTSDNESMPTTLDDDLMHFVESVLEVSEKITTNSSGKYSAILESLSKSDSLLRTMMISGSLSKVVVAESLLKLPEIQFEKVTGIKKSYTKPEVQNLL